MKYASIAIAAPVLNAFTYAVPQDLAKKLTPGFRVCVPFRKRRSVGIVTRLQDRPPKGLSGKEIKPIEALLDETPVFSETTLAWLEWIAKYYCAPIGEVFRAALPKRLAELNPPKTSRPLLPREMEYSKTRPDITLTKDQRDALEKIAREFREKNPKPFLLHGITGSGKTEIYLRLIEGVAKDGGQAIMLVPEIGLTPQLASRVVERFGDRVALYHSGLTDAQRHHQWLRMKSGEVCVVVGTRSAIFAPPPNLRAVIIDEEHDSSYKQDEGVLYHARDAAVMRAKLENAVIVLGSATPSMESFANTHTNKYHYIHLPERTGGGTLPAVEIVDMRRRSNAPSLSDKLIQAIEETLGRGEQSMIFLNRRGFANFLICEACGHTFDCPNCNISLAYHAHPPKLLCHYCDYTIPPPDACPSCHGTNIVPMGRGTERVEQDLAERFPKANVERLDRDTLTQSAHRTQIFKRMRDGDIDILVGTQLVAKGHDFPNVTLVGIVSADVALHIPDFRAAERTFQLITQVSGRAGRSEKAGRVVLQTYQPQNASLGHASAHDFISFFEEERRHREELSYPPFARLANVRISAADEKKARNFAQEVSGILKSHRNRLGLEKSLIFLGPAPAPMQKIKNRYRYQLLIKAKSAREMGLILSTAHPILHELQKKGVRVAIDVDPINLM